MLSPTLICIFIVLGFPLDVSRAAPKLSAPPASAWANAIAPANAGMAVRVNHCVFDRDISLGPSLHHRLPAVGDQGMPDNEPGAIRTEPEDRVGNFFGATH